MEILDRPNSNTHTNYPPVNRVIIWALRDMTPINKSGYRRNLVATIINRSPAMQNEFNLCDGCRKTFEECNCSSNAGYENYPEQYPED